MLKNLDNLKKEQTLELGSELGSLHYLVSFPMVKPLSAIDRPVVNCSFIFGRFYIIQILS